MNKKPGLLFSIALLAIIIIAASFDMNLGGNAPVTLRAGVNPDNVLYVCPVTSIGWDSASAMMKFASRYIYMMFSFFFIVLLFSWGWALYQNLLKDKFSADAYKNPWALTKMFFWAVVVCVVVAMTPNYFRTVQIRVGGQKTDMVLCENNSTCARAVSAAAVTNR